MLQVFLQVAGGLGLFLLGMVVMTDGLKNLAGKFLLNILTRFTHSPYSGALTGAGSTAVLQSSSATTVATVGFVSAGLLSFPQALGIIFGANLGTTITGWMVALLGIKLKLASILLPLILVGALFKLFGKGRLAAAGLAIAGFGLIFVGISNLQLGMSGLENYVSPQTFPPDNFFGRLQLIVIGIAITLITQSSSAGVATALTALHAGTISFPQAAALVIGMDVGTTVTAALATLGGSVETRRTGYSHVIYNLMTAVIAFMLLTPFTLFWESFVSGGLQTNSEIALVAFHSGFNFLGVILILPVAHRFARLMIHLVPAPEFTELDRLDRNLLREPEAALTAVGKTLDDITIRLFIYLQKLINRQQPDSQELDRIASILDGTHQYVDQIHLQPQDKQTWPLITSAVHMLDHLQRLHERCEEEPDRAVSLHNTASLQQAGESCKSSLIKVNQALTAQAFDNAARIAADNARQIEDQTEAIREESLCDIAMGNTDVPEGTDRLEAIRWLRRSSYHVWRICEHMDNFKQLSRHQTVNQVSRSATG